MSTRLGGCWNPCADAVLTALDPAECSTLVLALLVVSVPTRASTVTHLLKKWTSMLVLGLLTAVDNSPRVPDHILRRSQ